MFYAKRLLKVIHIFTYIFHCSFFTSVLIHHFVNGITCKVRLSRAVFGGFMPFLDATFSFFLAGFKTGM